MKHTTRTIILGLSVGCPIAIGIYASIGANPSTAEAAGPLRPKSRRTAPMSIDDLKKLPKAPTIKKPTRPYDTWTCDKTQALVVQSSVTGSWSETIPNPSSSSTHIMISRNLPFTLLTVVKTPEKPVMHCYYAQIVEGTTYQASLIAELPAGRECFRLNANSGACYK